MQRIGLSNYQKMACEVLKEAINSKKRSTGGIITTINMRKKGKEVSSFNEHSV